jgi:hypothetical protein
VAYTTATLTGTYQKLDGTPAEGTVDIIPNSRALIDSEGNVILSGRRTVTLDEDGSFSVVLPSTDDATIEPAVGRQYTVSAKPRHSKNIPAVEGVELAGGTTTDMADVTTAAATIATISAWLTEAEFEALVDRVDDLEANPGGVSSWNDLTDKPTIPDSPDDIGAAPVVHTHTSTQVTDFAEAVQDAVAAMLTSGANVTLTYNDVAGTLQVTAAGGDAEVMRDTIGAALVGTAGVNVAVNDGADTITLSVSGLTISQVTGLQAAIDDIATSLGTKVNASTYSAGLATKADATALTAETTRATNAELPVAFTGTVRGVWAGSTAYAVGDVVTTEGAVWSCITAHTSNGAGFRYDREKWSSLSVPALTGATRVRVRQIDLTSPGAGSAATPEAGIFQNKPRQFDYSRERVLIKTNVNTDLTGTSGTVATGSSIGGSVVLTPGTSGASFYTAPPLASSVDLTDTFLRAVINASTTSARYVGVQLTSAVGGTDFTNNLDGNLMIGAGAADDVRTGSAKPFSLPVSEMTATGTGANIAAITGVRFSNFGATGTVEILRGLTYHPNPSGSKAKVALWFDDGDLGNQVAAINVAARYGFPVTLAYVAENYTKTASTLTADQARTIQNYYGGQLAVHAFGTADHNRVQTGSQLFEQLLAYQHYGKAMGFHGVEDGAYYNTGWTGNSTNEDELTARKVFRSMRGTKARVPETLPPGDPMMTRAVSVSNQTSATLQAFVTRAVAHKGFAQFLWHALDATAVTQFTTFCAWLDTQRSTVDVVTPQTAYAPYCT